MASAELSKGKNGEVRLDYELKEGAFIRLWEQTKSSLLETTFKKDGSIVLQRLINGAAIDECIASTLKGSLCNGTKEVGYTKVVLNKNCPTCSKRSLVRYVESYGTNEIPVMPLYVCTECKAKSYHMTEEYLSYLVKSNPELFDRSELSKFEQDDRAFLAELKRYIISIFASKKIKCIQ